MFTDKRQIAPIRNIHRQVLVNGVWIEDRRKPVIRRYVVTDDNIIDIPIEDENKTTICNDCLWKDCRGCDVKE